MIYNGTKCNLIFDQRDPQRPFVLRLVFITYETFWIDKISEHRRRRRSVHFTFLNHSLSKAHSSKQTSLSCFLCDRNSTIAVDDHYSNFHFVNAGGPQGSVLSPTFNLLSSTSNCTHRWAEDCSLMANRQWTSWLQMIELKPQSVSNTLSQNHQNLPNRVFS